MIVGDLKGIPNDSEFVMNTAMLIGGLALSFALFEFSFNSIIAVAFKHLHGRRVEKEIPRQLSRARTYIRKAVGKLPELAPYRQELLEIEVEAKRLGDIRNDVVHGYMAHYDEAADHLLVFAKSQPELDKKSFHEVVLLEITAGALAQAVNDSVTLSTRTTGLLQCIVQAHVPQDTREEVFSRIRGKVFPGLKVP
jgi:hypothetical protein